jgi:hypothetical protein
MVFPTFVLIDLTECMEEKKRLPAVKRDGLEPDEKNPMGYKIYN